MNRFKSQLPQVIRPDILPTPEGFTITELDSVPGGMGFTGSLSAQYAKLDYDIIGGSNGMQLAFAEMVRSLAKVERPTVAIVVSDESADYWDEMKWLESALREVGLAAYTIKPRDVIFTEDALFLESAEGRVQIDVLYRFFELFDLKNIPKAELMLYGAKRRTVVMTPPPKTYLEEKLLFALFHHPSLQPFWQRELGKKTYQFLPNVSSHRHGCSIRVNCHHTPVIPDLEIDGLPVTNWRQIIPVSQRQRELVLKPSGFSELAWGSRGVSIGHDLPTEDWEDAVENALTRLRSNPLRPTKIPQSRTPHHDLLRLRAE